jgi:histone acetyltransferase
MSLAEESILYPNSHNLRELDDAAISAKIARHSRCDLCDCRGLNPPNDVTVLLEDDSEAFEVRLRDPLPDHPDYYPGLCRCSHKSLYHGNHDHATSEERTRRAKVAIRLDELLAVRSYKIQFLGVFISFIGQGQAC